jgi:hypothetical protein
MPLATTLERLPLPLCKWLLRNSFRGTVGVRTGEVVADVLFEQVGEGVGEFGGVDGWWGGRCLQGIPEVVFG